MNAKVTVVIVNWNGKADTLECLGSLASDLARGTRAVVVDNASHDGSADAIRRHFPRVEVIESADNRGFAGGNNLGIDAAMRNCSEFIFLLNNDAIIAKGALEQLLHAAQRHPEYGIFSPVIYHADPADKLWFAGSTLDLDSATAEHCNRYEPADHEPPHQIPWASGCAMLLRRSVLERVRGFDERFFLYWEDVDLCLRAARFGVKLAIVPGARVYHKVGRSCDTLASSCEYYYLRNILLLLTEHKRRERLGPIILALKSAAWRCRNFPGRKQRIFAAFRAVLDFSRKRFGRASSLRQQCA